MVENESEYENGTRTGTRTGQERVRERDKNKDEKPTRVGPPVDYVGWIGQPASLNNGGTSHEPTLVGYCYPGTHWHMP